MHVPRVTSQITIITSTWIRGNHCYILVYALFTVNCIASNSELSIDLYLSRTNICTKLKCNRISTFCCAFKVFVRGKFLTIF